MNAPLSESKPLSADEPPPLLTVVTVCRNAEKTITTALESLAAQTFTDWEWIMVDGASTDASVAHAELLEGKGRRRHIISEPDPGIYNAMNKGLRAARGRYIHFLNADDSYHDERVLEDVAADLIAAPETDFLYGNIVVKSMGVADVIYRSQPPTEALHTMVCGCLPHQGSFSKRDLFLHEPGYFNEDLRTAADYEWIMRVVSNPLLKLRYLDREIANFCADGASSRLEESLPEGFRVINECVEFQSALGFPEIISAYQKHVFDLRIQLREAWARNDALQVKRQNDRKKLNDAVSKKNELRARLDAMKEQRRKSWLRKWLRF